MDDTDHHLIVGKGAQDFARAMVSTSRPTSTRPTRARSGWNGSAASIPSTTSIPPSARRRRARSRGRWMRDGLIDPGHVYGTINCDGGQLEGRGLAASPPPAASRSRSRAAWATRRSSAPACGWTARWAPPARPAAGRRTSTTSPRTSSWRRCAAAAIQGRRHGGPQAHQGQHGREAPAHGQGPAELLRHLLRPRPRRPLRGRGPLRRAEGQSPATSRCARRTGRSWSRSRPCWRGDSIPDLGEPPTLEKIRATRARLGDLVVTTPVRDWEDPALARELAPGTRVVLKEELFQRTGTFKPRAALSVMLHLDADALRRGVRR